MKKVLSFTMLMVLVFGANASFATVITTIAGGGITTPATGLVATDVELNAVWSSKVDKNGNLYIAGYPQGGTGPLAIRVDRWGEIDRIYENPTEPVWYIDDICIDGAGNIFLPIYNKDLVYKLAVEGSVTVYAGDGTAGYSGDGGPATSAQLESPESITADLDGNVFVVHDTDDSVIRKIDNQGTITTFFDGTYLGFGRMDTLFADGRGNVYFSVTSQRKVWKVTGLNTATAISSASLPGSIRGVTGDEYGNIFYSYAFWDTGTAMQVSTIIKVDPFGVETTVVDSLADIGEATRMSTDKDGMLYVNFYSYPSGSNMKKLAFAPEVETVLPLDGTAGSRLIISGRYFGSNGIGGSVTFGGITASILSWSNDKIVCDIPAGASKTVDIVVTAADTQTSNLFSYRIR